MTVIELSAGKKHTIKVGDKVQEVTLRPGEIRYLPFIRAVMAIPLAKLPETTQVVPTTTYEKWSLARPKPTFDNTTFENIIDILRGYRGKKDLGFTPTIDNLISLLRKFKK
jgi:hypothetical protein